MSRFHSGGCQCGAIRYRVDGDLQDPHLCHCRMCQKASGNYFMALAFVPEQAFKLTRGMPAWFHSSKPMRYRLCRTTELRRWCTSSKHLSIYLKKPVIAAILLVELPVWQIRIANTRTMIRLNGLCKVTAHCQGLSISSARA